MVHIIKSSPQTPRWKKYDTQENPTGRYGHRAVCYMNKMVLFGGYNGKDRLNDTYEFDLDKRVWTAIDTSKSESTPHARDCHSAVVHKKAMYVFGGGDGYKWLNDVYAYDIHTQIWSEVKVAEGSVIPTGRAGHSAVVHKNKMLVFGGWNGRRTLNDLYEFDLDTKKWRLVLPKGNIVPQARDSHCAVTYQGKMMIIGGGDGKQRLNDVYEYDIEQETWAKVYYIGEVNAARAGHITCQFSDKLIIFGGGDGLRWLTDIYEFDLSAKKWYQVENSGEVAPGSYGLSSIVYKNRCIMFGGGDGKSWYNSIYEYVCEEEAGKKKQKENMWKIAQRNCYADCGIEFKHENEEAYVPNVESDMVWTIQCDEVRSRRFDAKSACTPCTPTSGRSPHRWFSTSSVKTLVSSRCPSSNM